jgi:hypothetical protein
VRRRPSRLAGGTAVLGDMSLERLQDGMALALLVYYFVVRRHKPPRIMGTAQGIHFSSHEQAKAVGRLYIGPPQVQVNLAVHVAGFRPYFSPQYNRARIYLVPRASSFSTTRAPVPRASGGPIQTDRQLHYRARYCNLKIDFNLVADGDLMESVCENEKDALHQKRAGAAAAHQRNQERSRRPPLPAVPRKDAAHAVGK